MQGDTFRIFFLMFFPEFVSLLCMHENMTYLNITIKQLIGNVRLEFHGFELKEIQIF